MITVVLYSYLIIMAKYSSERFVDKIINIPIETPQNGRGKF